MRVKEKTGHVYIEGSELVLEDFRELDPGAVDYVGRAPDAEAAVHRCMATGAHVLATAGVTLDTELVEQRFDRLTSDLNHSIGNFARRVDESANNLLDDDGGALPRALKDWFENLESLLGATFDESSKESAIAKLETVLDEARDEQIRAVRRLLNPEDKESPLGRWRSEILQEVKGQGRDIAGQLSSLKEEIAVNKARAEVIEQTAIKGRLFEEAVYEHLVRTVSPYEDVPELVGDNSGSEGKRGDIIVTLCPTDTPGREVRYVVEAKDRKLSLKRALNELEDGMRNRDAGAGLIVFADQQLSPVDEPFQWFDHKAIVVLDSSDPDTHALRLACMWARWTASREAPEATSGIDAAGVQALVEAARLSLKTVSTVKGSHTKAKTAIDQASTQLAALESELRGVLDQLELEVGKSESDLRTPNS